MTHPALERILRLDGADAALRLLADELSGADLTTFLLEVGRRRAATVGVADLMRQYEADRFVAPAQVDAARLATLHLAAFEAAAGFEPIDLAPLAPFGTHAVLGDVDQNNVVTTTRRGEVTADPTSSLALEAAIRRRAVLAEDPASAEMVRLAAVHRVLRAQVFDGPRSFAHFSLLGLVSAGRDRGNQDFELESLVEHVSVYAELARTALGAGAVVRVTDFGGGHGGVLDRAIAALGSDTVTCELWPERSAGRGYYRSVCFKLDVVVGGEPIEVADGGIVDWTQRLLNNGKERLMTSGLSLERLAQVS